MSNGENVVGDYLDGYQVEEPLDLHFHVSTKNSYYRLDLELRSIGHGMAVAGCQNSVSLQDTELATITATSA